MAPNAHTCVESVHKPFAKPAADFGAVPLDLPDQVLATFPNADILKSASYKKVRGPSPFKVPKGQSNSDLTGMLICDAK
jgi:hypothetical protein